MFFELFRFSILCILFVFTIVRLFTIDKMINKNTTLSVQFHNPIDTDSIEIQDRCSLHTKH